MPTLSIFAIESWYRPCQSSDHVGSQRQTLIPDRQTGARWTPEWRVTNEDPHLILAESILGAEVLRCWFTFYKHWFGPVLNALLALPFPVMEHDGLHFVTLAQDFFSALIMQQDTRLAIPTCFSLILKILFHPYPARNLHSRTINYWDCNKSQSLIS